MRRVEVPQYLLLLSQPDLQLPAPLPDGGGLCRMPLGGSAYARASRSRAAWLAPVRLRSSARLLDGGGRRGGAGCGTCAREAG